MAESAREKVWIDFVNPLILALLLVISVGFAVTLFLSPKWFGVSMLRHRLWDQHDALRSLARETDEDAFDLVADEVLRTVRVAHLLTPARALMVHLAGKPDLPPDRHASAMKNSLLLTSAEHRKLLHKSLRDLDQLRVRLFMFTSWTGILMTVVLVVPLSALGKLRRSRPKSQTQDGGAALPAPPKGMAMEDPAPLEQRVDKIEDQIYVVFPKLNDAPPYGARGMRPLLR